MNIIHSIRIHYKLIMLDHTIMSATVAVLLLLLAWFVVYVTAYTVLFNRPQILHPVQEIRNNPIEEIRQNPVAEYV